MVSVKDDHAGRLVFAISRRIRQAGIVKTLSAQATGITESTCTTAVIGLITTHRDRIVHTQFMATTSDIRLAHGNQGRMDGDLLPAYARLRRYTGQSLESVDESRPTIRVS